MVKIRPFQDADYNMICSWWEHHNEPGPLPGMMIENGTFIVELDNIPSMTMTVYFTQSKEAAYFEGYCSTPGLSKELRNELGVILWDHCYKFAKENGYKRVNILTEKMSLVERYKDLGMTENIRGLISLGRVL